MIGYWLGFATSLQSCATICGKCLVNRDRATWMLICERVAAGLLGVAGPMLATRLVTRSGGARVGGIRPLFVVGLNLLIRMPPLVSIPETLYAHLGFRADR